MKVSSVLSEQTQLQEESGGGVREVSPTISVSTHSPVKMSAQTRDKGGFERQCNPILSVTWLQLSGSKILVCTCGKLPCYPTPTPPRFTPILPPPTSPKETGQERKVRKCHRRGRRFDIIRPSALAALL
ncbi:unnamed protein product [Pleuronectes platessa]|uniref:Uncharacterized protein n=1 Tax=Pleuronectes platessa TaxID=8262 RepID=A0A9N7ZDK6_PLEPL|nr:unnamed protein product [Pleuronectes platessa]